MCTWWWLFLICFSSSNAQNSQYECGSHGRFEYCIDDIPGCVIGCHCHPGYYFDTDTKICEPNIKLTQDFRRHYFSEPTRMQLPPLTPPVPDEPETTTTNAIDDKVDEIAKDADDLGDWLYNQFFKTIENQVINKTKDEDLLTPDEPTLLTRRSGSIFDKIPVRRSHKYTKSKKKKKKKRKGIKNKLLRITEDDSLFDSSSNSESTSDESSKSSSSSSDDSDESRHSKHGKIDGDHGHKKIVVYNKRPRPPLPSFIFMPNMDTPFYPPVGLPPPAMPMYPMVPVPPVPMFPYPGMMPHMLVEATTCVSDSSTTTPTTPDEASTTMVSDDDNDKDDKSTSSVTSTTEVTAQDDEKEDKQTTPASEDVVRSRVKGRTRSGPRNKLMQKLREKIKRKNKLEKYFAKQYQETESPIIGDDIPPEFMSKHRLQPPRTNAMAEDSREIEDVDFKYLTQLIHRVDLNQTIDDPPNTYDFGVNPPPSRRYYFDTNMPHRPNNMNTQPASFSNEPINNIPNQPIHYIPNQPIQNIPNQPMNNFYNQNNIRFKKKNEELNNSYYTNLGRQIASMIRNIDAKGDHEVDIEIEKSNMSPSTNPIFNENRFAPRSYWERSVRSPLTYLNSYKKEMDYLKKSNKNLFSLENQVEIAATTSKTLGLQELENIISEMEKAKSKLPKKYTKHNNAESSVTSFNVNLLPGNDMPFYSNGIVHRASQNIQTKHDPPKYSLNRKKQNSQSPLKSDPFSNFRRISPDTVEDRNLTVIGSNVFPMITPTRKPLIISAPKNKPVRIQPKSQPITNIKSTFVQVTTNKTNVKYQFNPMLHNRKRLNYYSNNNNRYIFEKAVMPLKFSVADNFKPYGQLIKPSYFHHQLHHFGYFDD